MQEVGHHRGGLLRAAVHRRQRREPVAESEEPHLPADGQRGSVSAEAARQVLRGASPDSTGTDEVRLFQLFRRVGSKWPEAHAWNEPLL